MTNLSMMKNEKGNLLLEILISLAIIIIAFGLIRAQLKSSAKTGPNYLRNYELAEISYNDDGTGEAFLPINRKGNPANLNTHITETKKTFIKNEDVRITNWKIYVRQDDDLPEYVYGVKVMFEKIE